ncbi:alginate O-acetyltransferase AlgX-related protein [Trinickia fusca]|nr:twin-arginine translocation pathway signal [Trinickia fusca]
MALAAIPLAGAISLPRTARAAAAGAVPKTAGATALIEGRDRWLFPGWESLTEDSTAACLNVVDLIGRVANKMAARSIHCAVVIAPLKARACADKLAEGTTLSTAVAGRYSALVARAKAIGLDLVDGEAALARVDTQEDATYIRADYHWSAHTAEAQADATAERLIASGALHGEKGGATKLGDWTEERNYGDLAELLPPERKRVIGKDRFIVRQTDSDGDALTAATPVVQVVGNSMVQPYLGFPQKLSNALERPVGLKWTFGDVGPWKTLLDYLESPAFKATPPQAIVWQFNEGQMMSGPGAVGQWDVASVMADDAWLARVTKALG